MLRRLLVVAAALLASTAVAQTPGPVVIYSSEPVISSRPVVQRPQPAVGLGG